MPDLELEPPNFRRPAAPRVISRRMALALIPIQLAIAAFLQWLVMAAHAQWWEGLIVWPPLIMAGALIVRVWPLLLLGEK
jgi:hypothetical protein